MAEDYGIKISKAGIDVTNTPTEATKKNFTILSTASTIKVSTQAVISADSNVAHGLGFTPAWDAYILENSLSEAHPATGYWNAYWHVSADDTYLYCDEISGSTALFYIIYLNEP